MENKFNIINNNNKNKQIKEVKLTTKVNYKVLNSNKNNQLYKNLINKIKAIHQQIKVSQHYYAISSVILIEKPRQQFLDGQKVKKLN